MKNELRMEKGDKNIPVCSTGTRPWSGALLSLLAIFTLTGCTSFPTAIFKYSDGQGGMVALEISKEIEAKELNVTINAKEGTATISAKEWSSKSKEAIEAQGSREAEVLDKSSKLVERAAEGAARGAVKAIVPSPIP